MTRLEVQAPIQDPSSYAKGRWGLLARFDSWIEDSPVRAFLCLTLLYSAAVIMLSSLKLLWLDELITLHIARLPDVAAIWRALSMAADPNPPLTHVLVHFMRGLFGEHELALRFPAMFGYWTGLLCLFAYLRRYLPVTWSLGGTLLSMSMAAFDYSYESRSYGIFYGLAMLAFYCWSEAVDSLHTGSRRNVALFGMIAALAGGISANYFAVLAFFPIAAGELTHTIVMRDKFAGLRRFDLRVWIALVVAATPLLAYRSMISRSIAQFAPYAWNKVSVAQVADSYTEMVEIVLYPILLLLLAGCVGRYMAPWVRTLCSSCQRRLRPHWLLEVSTGYRPRSIVPRHEAVAILFLMAYPILGYIIASIRGGMLSPRFVIPVCFGFAISGTLTAFRIFGSYRIGGTVFLCICLAWFVARESIVGYWYAEQRQCFYKVIQHLDQAMLHVPADAPIVIADPLLALTFQHYAPAKLTSRIVFPVDFPAIRHYRRDDSPEENFWSGRRFITDLPVVPLASFQKAAAKYLIIASDGNWLLNDLRDHRYPVERLSINTRAGAIGGFTPLFHGVPVFYVSSGDTAMSFVVALDLAPEPFTVTANLP